MGKSNGGSSKAEERKFKAVFFDFDGVLADSERLYQRFWSQALSEFGYTPTSNIVLNLRSCDASLGKKIMEEAYGEPFPFMEVRQRRIELMNAYLEKHPMQPKQGAIECLRFLKQKGVNAYVVSSTPMNRLTKAIEALGIGDYIKQALSAKDVERGKPYPDVYLEAIKLAHLPKEDVLVIEDSPNGITSAFEAGLSVAMVDDLDKADEERKAKIIFELESLSELTEKDIF